MRDRRSALVCFAAFLVVNGAARAEDPLADPTAPPASIASAAPSAPTQSTPVLLQSVLIAGGRRVAVIDGKRVRIGDRVGGGVVAAIEPTEVRLDGPAGAVRLPLHRTQAKEPSGSKEKTER